MDEASGSRRPGRPRQSEQEVARVRAAIVAAAERVFAEHGYRGVTAARLIEAADLSRTNFYRYFRTPDEALQVVLDRFGADLVQSVADAVRPLPYGAGRVVAGINAFLAWSRRYRHLLPSVIADLHDPTSPVSKTRREIVESMSSMMSAEYEKSGLMPDLERAEIDIFVNGLEYTAFRLHVDTEGTDADVDQARWTMLRLAVALLGRPRDWQDFVAVVEARAKAVSAVSDPPTR